MKRKSLLTHVPVFFLLFGSQVYGAGADIPLKAVPESVRPLDYRSLPSDADLHHRTKWSDGEFIYIDDDEGAPSLYVFDRSGQVKFSTMIQIPDIDRMRVDDFAAAPDGSLWAGGHASSRIGQETFFLAHISPPGTDVQIVQTTPYRPCQLSVAPDGTIWTVGYALTRDPKGKSHEDPSQDVLRHFNGSGKLLATAIPLSTVGLMRVLDGYLEANGDRLGWYSPTHGAGAYVEFSPDMKVLHSYPVAPTTDRRSLVEGFALTPTGHAYVTIAHPTQDGRPPALYELDRSADTWTAVDAPRDAHGNIPWLEGNDGELLILTGPPDKSKLQVLEVSQAARQ